MEPFKGINQLRKTVGNKGIRILVNNKMLDLWSLYALLGKNLRIEKPFFLYEKNSMYHDVLARSHFANPSEIKYLLTDTISAEPRSHLIWSNGFYYLWTMEK